MELVMVLAEVLAYWG